MAGPGEPETLTTGGEDCVDFGVSDVELLDSVEGDEGSASSDDPATEAGAGLDDDFGLIWIFEGPLGVLCNVPLEEVRPCEGDVTCVGEATVVGSTDSPGAPERESDRFEPPLVPSLGGVETVGEGSVAVTLLKRLMWSETLLADMLASSGYKSTRPQLLRALWTSTTLCRQIRDLLRYKSC